MAEIRYRYDVLVSFQAIALPALASMQRDTCTGCISVSVAIALQRP